MRLVQRRRIHVRRPKAARTIDTALRRGLINNGIIDIVDDSSSEDDSEFEEDETASGTVYRVPAKGVKLDFIDKVHRTRAAEISMSHLPPPQATRMNAKVLQAELNSRPVVERQVVLSLVQFGSDQKDISLTGDAIQDLINVMTAEAPLEVIGKVDEDERHASSNGLASPLVNHRSGDLSGTQRKQLEALQELIQRKLAAPKPTDIGDEIE
ncbi:hypothetical protein ANO11243_036970 [Dothideomycetidae sp. 11243]|nr:hypothetical protein ANO11243_036970 [fungal sp. No.11243]